MRRNTWYLVGLAVVAIVVAGALYTLRQRSAPPAIQTTAVVTPRVVAPVAPAPAVLLPADCLMPGPAPVPPDGATASAADMQLGHDVIQNFVLQLEAYQTCRNNQLDHAPANVTAAQKQSWLDQGNAAVDQAHALADAFTVQLKAFKARAP